MKRYSIAGIMSMLCYIMSLAFGLKNTFDSVERLVSFGFLFLGFVYTFAMAKLED